MNMQLYTSDVVRGFDRRKKILNLLVKKNLQEDWSRASETFQPVTTSCSRNVNATPDA